MAKRKPSNLHGVIAIDKPLGLTSRAVVNRVSRLLGEKRAGHAGTLDPDASGVLTVVVGDATTMVRWLTDAPKAYVGRVRFGAETSTDDAVGEITRQAPWPTMDDATLGACQTQTATTIWQVPPSVSALQTDGVRDHERVRRGEHVERPPRPVLLRGVTLLEIDAAAGEASYRLDVGSGFYVRAWARDLGRQLGSAAHLCGLRRVQAGGTQVDDAHRLESLEAEPLAARVARLRSIAEALRGLVPILTMDEPICQALAHGKRPRVDASAEAAIEDEVLVVDAAGDAVGICRIEAPVDPWPEGGGTPDLRREPASEGWQLRVVRGLPQDSPPTAGADEDAA